MKNNPYTCVNCNLSFETEEQYIEHYKSEHHRFNVKRKLVGLPPLSIEDYTLQFLPEESSKQSTVQDLYCDICSKKFTSAGTYRHHINSKKHKKKRDNITKVPTEIMSHSSSSSQFSILGAEKAESCLFCHHAFSKEHMRKEHNFPPFEKQCVDFDGLIDFCRSLVKEGICLFCGQKFNSEESVKQHMADVGHAKLDMHNFEKFEQFYFWRAQSSSSSSDSQDDESMIDTLKSSCFEELTNPTLKDVEEKRQARIGYTATGVVINGKQMGYRQYKKYYKQYLGRQVVNEKAKYQPAIECDGWKKKAQHHVQYKIPAIPKGCGR